MKTQNLNFADDNMNNINRGGDLFEMDFGEDEIEIGVSEYRMKMNSEGVNIVRNLEAPIRIDNDDSSSQYAIEMNLQTSFNTLPQSKSPVTIPVEEIVAYF